MLCQLFDLSVERNDSGGADDVLEPSSPAIAIPPHVTERKVAT
ncbi:MAG TPA: hypothetical protein VGC42_06265 [Kofleriaceae bacterium]